MTKKKQLIILLGVLVCIAVAAVFILKQKNMTDLKIRSLRRSHVRNAVIFRRRRRSVWIL